jgi:hypothetical protein
MNREFVRLISDYREPNDNEFFFREDPKGTTPMREMLEYLEDNFNLRFEEIETWKIRTTRKGHSSGYDQLRYGYKIVRSDES